MSNAKAVETEQWKRAAELAGAGVCIVDENFDILYVNACLAEMLGYSVAEIMSRNLLLFVPEDLKKTMNSRMKDSNRCTFTNYEFILPRKDGSTISAFISSYCIFKAKGRFKRGTLIIRNITKEKGAEELLGASRNTLETVFNAISGSLHPVDGEGRISELMNRIKQLLENNRPICSIEEKLQILDEIRLHTEHLKELVEERIQELLKAERLVAVGQAAAMIAHDLRNPLQDIRLAHHLLGNHYLNKREEERLLNQIDRNIAYANGIIDSLLIYSQERPLNSQKTNINQLLKESLRESAPPEHIKMKKNLNKVPNIFVDQNLMKRVFQNLILNAIQAMEKEGTITLETKSEKSSVAVSIQDTGKGISEIEMNLIWRPFYTSKSKGMGLGLPIAKRVVEMHGGTIDIESKQGEGSTFTVHIPTCTPHVTTGRPLEKKVAY